MKTIMILGASILQLPAIEKAKEMGLKVIVADIDPNAEGFSVDGIVKKEISTIDTSAILEVAKQYRIDGIITLASDMPMQSVAVVCNEMGLAGISEDTALKTTNKAVMRDVLKDNGIPVPLYFRVNSKNEFLEAVEKVRKTGCRCIVKPVDNSGSRGVNLLSPDVDLNEVYKYSRQYSHSGEIIVEEFMEGPEVSVETLAVDGLIHVIQITDKLTTGAPYFVEMGHSQPSQLSEEIKKQIARIAVAANKAVGIQNGPSHTEIKITKDGPKIVEIGARLGGDCITTHLVPLSTGVDMVECNIRIALGEKPDLQPKWNRGASIRYFTSDKGKIQNIFGIEKAEKIPGIIQVSVVHGIGDVINGVCSSVDRVGFVVAQADNSYDAAAIAEKGIEAISMQVIEE